MWRVSYYLVGGTCTAKTFPTLTEATDFMVYKICTWNVHDCYLIKD
jgi:hypothetical protein